MLKHREWIALEWWVNRIDPSIAGSDRFNFQIRYPINQRSPRGVNNRYRVPGAGGMLAGGFNQKSGAQRVVNKQKKPKPKKETKKSDNDVDDEDAKKAEEGDDAEVEEKQENG